MIRTVLAGALLVLSPQVLGKSPHGLRIERAGDGGMVGLADGTIVAWNTRADIQLRSPAGSWHEVQHLPAGFAVTAAGAGNLAYVLANVVGPRSVAPKGSGVVSHLFAVGPSGTIQDLSGVPGDVSSIAAAGGRTWVASPAGVFTLSSTGVLGPRVGDAGFAAVLIPRSGASPIVCTEADLSRATYHAATCRSDAPKWSATGTWTSPPFPCGDVLIERGDRELVSRSMASGQEVARAPISRGASISCGDSFVLVGTDRIDALEPKTLQRRWSTSRLERPITAACLQGDEVVYFTPAGPGAARRPQGSSPAR